MKQEITGIRTDSCTGVETEVKLTWEVIDAPSGKAFQLYGGPTGYESFYLTEKSINNLKNGWLACAGTKNSWARLFISAEEMTKALNSIILEAQAQVGRASLLGIDSADYLTVKAKHPAVVIASVNGGERYDVYFNFRPFSSRYDATGLTPQEAWANAVKAL